MLMVGGGWRRENQMVFSDTDFAKTEAIRKQTESKNNHMVFSDAKSRKTKSKPKANGKQKKPNGFVWFSFGF